MSSGDHIRKSFRERFEPAGQGFLYRAAERAPGVPVSAEERSALEADLDRRIRRFGVLADGRLQAGAAFAAALVAGTFGAPFLVQCGIFLGVLIVVGAAMPRLNSGPSRRLAGRAPVDNGLTQRDVFWRDVAKKTWRQMLSLLFVSSAGVANMYLHKYEDTSLLVTRAIFTVAGVFGVGYTLVELGAKVWLAYDNVKRK